jgi:hypothetical protein
MRRMPVIVYSVALVLSSVAVVVGVRVLGDHSSALDRFKGEGQAVPTVPTSVPGPGQAFVTGTVDRVTAEGAQAPPVATPFTISAVERGAGKATIENALVDGKRTAIFWGGGTPLPISGEGGAIDLSGSKVEVDGAGVTWSVDGASRALTPGKYRAGAPVAVGASGLGSSRDSVEFTADARTVVNGTGGVVVKVPPQRLEITGPGKVSASGRLKVQLPAGSRPAGSIKFGDGPYKVVLTSAGGKLGIDAILQGPLSSS